MAETGGLRGEESSVRDKLAYGDFMDGERDEIEVDGEVWTKEGKAPKDERL